MFQPKLADSLYDDHYADALDDFDEYSSDDTAGYQSRGGGRGSNPVKKYQEKFVGICLQYM